MTTNAPVFSRHPSPTGARYSCSAEVLATVSEPRWSTKQITGWSGSFGSLDTAGV